MVGSTAFTDPSMQCRAERKQHAQIHNKDCGAWCGRQRNGQPVHIAQGTRQRHAARTRHLHDLSSILRISVNLVLLSSKYLASLVSNESVSLCACVELCVRNSAKQVDVYSGVIKASGRRQNKKKKKEKSQW